jgi:hypothetical protein
MLLLEDCFPELRRSVRFRDPNVSFADLDVTITKPVANSQNHLPPYIKVTMNPAFHIPTPTKARFWLFGAVLALCGCQVSRHEPDAKFVDLYADLKLVSTALNNDLERAGEMRRAVLARHGMSPAEFHEHYMRLAGNPEAWRPFQERVIARLDEFQENRKDTTNGRERD